MNRTNPPDSAAERRSSVSVFVASTYGDMNWWSAVNTPILLRQHSAEPEA